MASSSTKVSAGLVLTNGKVILGCVPYGRNDLLDIPKGFFFPNGALFYLSLKGLIEDNESPEQAVIRETKEEIGMDFKGEKLEYKGKFFQYKGKYLHIFVVEKQELPELNSLHCNSTFFHQKFKKEVQEHVGFKYIAITAISKHFYKSLVPILEKVCGQLCQKELQTKKLKLQDSFQEKEEDSELDELLQKLKKKNEEEAKI